jgi:hypothetical protein
MFLCRRRARFSFPALMLLALGACDGGRAPGRAPDPPPPAAASAASASDASVAAGVRDDGGVPLAERYYRAYLAETIDGDRAAARVGYEAVLEAGAGEGRGLASRAAVRLAGLDAQEGRNHEALELLARAASLGGDDPAVLEAVDALRLSLSGSGARPDTYVRGPAVGSTLDGASASAATRFAAAEKLLDVYQRRHVRPRVEKFDEDRERKETALRVAEEAYRQVIATADPVGAAAAAFRIASLHHDYALLVLTIETPPELEPAYAAPVRRDLRNRAQRNFKDAQAAYAESLAAGADAPGAELWHAAARSGARAVEDMLR